MNTEPIIKETVVNAPVSKVWDAITKKEEMKQWYFDLAEFRPEPGFEFSFEAGRDENSKFLHQCKITEVIPDKKLAYSWKYPPYQGDSIVSFDLLGEDGKTRVKLTHSGVETFPPDIPDLARSNFEEGWEFIVKKSLKEYLEKKKN